MSQPELPVPNCRGFGGSTAPIAAHRGRGSVFAHFGFYFCLICHAQSGCGVLLLSYHFITAATAKRLLCIISSELITAALALNHFSSSLQRAAQNKEEEGGVGGGSGMSALPGLDGALSSLVEGVPARRVTWSSRSFPTQATLWSLTRRSSSYQSRRLMLKRVNWY